MTKTFAAIALATLVASAAAPAFASDGSEIANAQVQPAQVQPGQVQPAYLALSDGMHAYASTRGANWHHAQGASTHRQAQNQWELIDR